MFKKGRGNVPKGEKNHLSKFKEKDILKIRKLGKMGYKYKEIGNLFNTTSSAIGVIINRITWKHL
jgi:hypothetical protein